MILTENIPYFNKVSLCKSLFTEGFYIPSNSKFFHFMKQTIESHGGKVLQEHECFTFQIIHTSESTNKSYQIEEYYSGFIYDFRWITESIKAGLLLTNKDFWVRYMKPNQSKKKLDFQNRRPLYSIWEAIQLCEIIDADRQGNAKWRDPFNTGKVGTK